MGAITNQLRQSDLLARAYRRFRDFVYGVGWGGFHHDPIYRKLVLDLLEAFPFTSFVETGTYRGYSTELVAARRPDMPVFTAEASEQHYQLSRRSLKRYPNVTQFFESSEKAIAALLASGRAGTMPLYYLDAHWQTYWPLRDELKHIARAGGKAAILIDDFEVPGHPQFGFDVDGGSQAGTTEGAGINCNLDYVRGSLLPPNAYHAAFPKYAFSDAFGTDQNNTLRGHVILFQNMSDEYEQFLARPLAKQHYFGSGSVGVEG